MLKTLARAAAALAVASASLHATAQTSYDYLLLAASWEPGFCASHDTPECTNLAGTYAATSLSLHGLWPNRYDGNQHRRFIATGPDEQRNTARGIRRHRIERVVV